VVGVLPGRAAKQKTAEAWSATLVSETPAEEPPAAVSTAPAAPVSVAVTSSFSVPKVPAPPVAAPIPNLPQVAPAPALATARTTPSNAAPVVDTEFAPVTAVTVMAPTALPPSPVQEAVLLDEVRTLERRGDEIMAERRVDDALDLYATALDSAVEYAERKGSSATDKDHVVMLLRKLAVLQGQHTSTAEARANFQRARKTLLELRAKGHWTRERAKALDEMEARLLRLPRD
jgi:hypothetical protein